MPAFASDWLATAIATAVRSSAATSSSSSSPSTAPWVVSHDGVVAVVGWNIGTQPTAAVELVRLELLLNDLDRRGHSGTGYVMQWLQHVSGAASERLQRTRVNGNLWQQLEEQQLAKSEQDSFSRTPLYAGSAGAQWPI